MKTKILAILLIFFVGIAGAVTIPEPTYNFGPSAGFKNAATIQASDLYAEDDFKVGDDAQIVGDLAITGASSFASLYLSSGLNVAGTSGLNYTTVTDLRAADDGHFVGDLTAGNLAAFNYTTVTDLRAADDGYFAGDLRAGTLAAFNTTTATTVTATGLIQGADGRFTDDFLVDDDAYVDGTATVNDAIINTTLDVNGAATFENVSLTQNKRLTFNTAGTGYIQWLTSGNYMTIKGNPQFDDGYTWSGTASPSSASDLVAIGGASDIDFSLSSGVTKTGAGAVTVNGPVTVSTGDTVAVTDADALTVGGVIVPQEMVITIPIGASEVDQTAFIADDAWQITKIEEVHTVAQNTAYPNTGSLSVTKCTGTTAPGSGTALHNTTMQLNSTVNTVVTPTLNAATGALNLADGNRIALNFNGTMTTFAGGCVTIHMKRI